jgi:transcriptional regulator with PAS, ATPase and Fis domain
MSLPLQSKLLSFLESRSFRRLGGTEDIRVTTRIVCATNATLEERVAKKEFRKDLFFRINVVSVVLPPLRTMGQDVIAIAEALARNFAADFTKSFEGFTSEAERKLVGYDWPGNVRELRNVLERAMIFASGPQLDAPDLVLLKTEDFGDGDASAADGYFRFRSGGTLEDLEFQYIKHILTSRKASYAELARLLGISKKTLWEKRKKYALDPEVETEAEAGAEVE